MQTTKVIHVVSAHAEGEVGDVIVGGVQPPPGDTLWEQSRFIANDDSLRNFVLNEPRGGVFRHVNLLVPAKNPPAPASNILANQNKATDSGALVGGGSSSIRSTALRSNECRPTALPSGSSTVLP